VWAPALRAAARRLVRGAASADDLVQESLLRAYRTFDNFAPGTNARAWLFTILYSVFANTHRRARIERQTVPIEDLETRFDRGLELAQTTAVAPLESVLRSEDLAQLERALDALPEPFRSAVLLVDLDELSYEDAAAIMTCPVGTLRSRLFRGRRALAALLGAKSD